MPEFPAIADLQPTSIAVPQSKARPVSRNPQLDLLRATAILGVLAFHIVQMSPRPIPAVMAFVRVGQFGVDLFFVLSGWLIGTLYWKELARCGDVRLLRFWGRRWMRTIPPYVAALILAWGAVQLDPSRHDPFNWGYLVFAQNYYQKIPFFLVSWSLCIEEHFYLFMPFILVLIGNRRRLVPAIFVVLVLAAPVCRWILSIRGLPSEFGFAHTATHLRMEGLLLGFLGAWLPLFKPRFWKRAVDFSIWAFCATGAAVCVLWFCPKIWMYRFGLTTLAIALVSLLIYLVGRKPRTFANSRFIYCVALSSYSLYLTHALMLHVARKVMEKTHLAWPMYFPIALSLIALFGGLFYFAFERSAIRLRDKWISRRQVANVPQILTPSLPSL